MPRLIGRYFIALMSAILLAGCGDKTTDTGAMKPGVENKEKPKTGKIAPAD